ncbi:MAG TPA: bifunctional 3-(3-hydroxy-phenyl)propionate/3-hydroxycinnamic acid hydroxylase [Ramlibacter sp.]|nr:bifunctional 3-(3-hydroxy-phenyl)propionate/3-hydroxycinnamic acid hydroxylase [Ramlibacter sp.]
MRSETRATRELAGSHNEPLRFDVLVVGLGPVGAALANLLAGYGVRVLAIDQAREIFMKPRAIALDNEALRILQMVGVREGDFATIGIPQVQYHSALFGRFARIDTSRVIDGHPALVTFHQPELETVLRSKLAQAPTACALPGTALEAFEDDGMGVTARLRDRGGKRFEVRARFLVGADGASSLVRRSLGLDFPGASCAQDWLIVDATDVPDPVDHCEFVCDPRRPTPHMPAPGGRQRWEFMLHAGETREQMESPDSVKRLLAPWCDASRIRIERTAVYRFHARAAAAFSKGRCFLAGDAAHITPPFAGQGLVAGLRDVANLGWKLAWVIRGQAAESILASYDQERRPHARKIIHLARFLGALVMPRNRLSAFLIHGTMRLLGVLPGTRALFEDLKIKPQNTFDSGLFRRGPATRLRGGATFAQAWVRGPASAPMLSDDALGARWALVGFGVDPARHIAAELLARWKAMGGCVWQWCHRGQAQHLGAPASRLEALDDTHFQKVPFGWVALVRPDRCVFAEGPLEEAGSLVRMALGALQQPGAGAHLIQQPVAT